MSWETWKAKDKIRATVETSLFKVGDIFTLRTMAVYRGVPYAIVEYPGKECHVDTVYINAQAVAVTCFVMHKVFVECNSKSECTCSISQLMGVGCRCGHLKALREKK